MTATEPTTLDNSTYDELVAFAHELRDEKGPADAALSPIAASVLFHEARLLDAKAYDEWLALYTDDCIFWMPMTSNMGDPRREVAYTLDDRRRLQDRIALLRTGAAHAQDPPSRTVRLVGSVEAWPDGPERLRVRASVITSDWRRDTVTQNIAHAYYLLVQTPAGWRIRFRVLHRVDADGPIRNIAF